MWRVAWWLTVAGGLAVAACSRSGVVPSQLPLGSAAGSPTSLVNSRKPVDVYTDVARLIHACWLRSETPALPNHNFFAEARPGSRTSGEARITLYEQTPDSKKGLRAVTIDLTAAGSGTSVAYTNHRLDEALSNRLMLDLNRWARGDQSCGPGARS